MKTYGEIDEQPHYFLDCPHHMQVSGQLHATANEPRAHWRGGRACLRTSALAGNTDTIQHRFNTEPIHFTDCCACSFNSVYVYEGCPESIRPF